MGRIYLGNKDRDILLKLRNKITDTDEINVLDKILQQNEFNRIKYNEVAKIYKAEKRKTNKNFARSKKEIAKRRECNEEI